MKVRSLECHHLVAILSAILGVKHVYMWCTCYFKCFQLLNVHFLIIMCCVVCFVALFQHTWFIMATVPQPMRFFVALASHVKKN